MSKLFFVGACVVCFLFGGIGTAAAVATITSADIVNNTVRRIDIATSGVGWNELTPYVQGLIDQPVPEEFECTDANSDGVFDCAALN